MKTILITVILLMTTGCAGLIDYAAESLAEMKDTTRYESIRSSVDVLCDTTNYDQFVDRYGKETVDKWMTTVCSPVTRTIDPSIK